MHPVRRQRLITVIFIVCASSAAVGLVIFALNENMNLFYPPSKIAEAPIGKTIRAGGCVIPGSISRDSETLRVSFAVTDGASSLNVHYEGILPDLFAEGEAAVLTGELNQAGDFDASEVLAKHDETYMPREVADTMAVEGQNHSATCGVLNYDS